MSRAPNIVQAEMLALSPPGYTRDPTSIWGKKLLAAATEASLVEQTAEGLHQEVDPRTANLLIPEWQAEFGDDPYGIQTSLLSEAGLQNYLYWRLINRGGQSISFYEGLAAAWGISITIEETQQTVYGNAVYGGDVYCETPNQFQWLVIVPQTASEDTVYGDAQYGDYYGYIAESPVVPLIEALAPAHTLPVFSYTGT